MGSNTTLQKIKLHITLLFVLLILSLAALVYVLSVFTPDMPGSIVLFYFIVAFGGFAAATLLGFQIRKLFGQREFSKNYFTQASRQGLWLSLILVISLILLRYNLFSLINAGLLVLTFVFFESYLLTKNNRSHD